MCDTTTNTVSVKTKIIGYDGSSSGSSCVRYFCPQILQEHTPSHHAVIMHQPEYVLSVVAKSGTGSMEKYFANKVSSSAVSSRRYTRGNPSVNYFLAGMSSTEHPQKRFTGIERVN